MTMLSDVPSPLRVRSAGWLSAHAATLLGIGILTSVAVGSVLVTTGTVPSRGGAEFLAALVVAFACYGVASLILERRRAPVLGVVVIGVAIQLALLGGPVLLSADAYSYSAYGRIDAALGGNPYRDVPAGFATDPVVGGVAGGWRHTPSVYGPVFAGLSDGVAHLAGSDPAAAVRLYRVVAAASMIVLICLAALLSNRPDRAAAFVGWNPLLAVHFAGGGHNDATMMAIVLGALLLGSHARPGTGAVLWMGASAIKWVPIPLYALWALAAHRRGERAGIAAFAGAALVVASAATWRYGVDWLRVVSPLSRAAEAQTHYSVARRLADAGLPSAAAAAIVVAAAALGVALLIRSAWVGTARLGLAACLLVATSPWLLPWYAVWPVALAAIEKGRAPRLIALALAAYLLAARVSLS